MDSMIYARNRWDLTDVRASANTLSNVKFNCVATREPRNREFTKLIAFELDRGPEEKRSMMSSKLSDFIRKVRGEESLARLTFCLPSFKELH